MTTAETLLNLHVTLASGWAEIASLLAADVVRLAYTLECHPLRTQDEVVPLIREKSWNVFIGIWPDHLAAAATSIAITKETGAQLQASELVYCGTGAALIAIRRGSLSTQARAARLVRSLSGRLRQLALQLAYRETGSQPASPSARAHADSEQLERLTRKLNDQLTILVNCAQSLLTLVGHNANVRQFTADLLDAAADIAETSKQVITLASAGPSSFPS